MASVLHVHNLIRFLCHYQTQSMQLSLWLPWTLGLQTSTLTLKLNVEL